MGEPVVWITGASSGIGAEMARAYAARGARVVLSARRAELLGALAAELGGPERARVLPLDLTDGAARLEAAEAAWAWRGGLDVVIHNAGVSQRARALETTLETTRRLMEINFFGPVALTQAVLPRMLERDRGQLVFVSSVLGHVATPLRSTYAASKHAIRAWADSLRAELHGTGVGVTVICPGYVATGISASALRADGTPQGAVEATDQGGMPAAAAVAEMVRAIDKRRPEVLVGGPELAGVWLKRFAPGLVARVLHRFAPRMADGPR